MNRNRMAQQLTHILFVPLIGAALAVTGCASQPKAESNIEGARSHLEELQSNSLLSNRAPVAIREAEDAVNAAEEADLDSEEGRHLARIARHKVNLAEARAWERYYDDERDNLVEERDRARLAARTREAERARAEAQQATLHARASEEETARLRSQIEELNARPTDRGLVLTLGDVLFDTGQHVLKPGAHGDLDRLADFLREYDERDVRIMGHTDSTGDAGFNQELSQRRAEAVKQYLVAQGIEPRRVLTFGRGESAPVASNDTPGGRQMNRRVDILIENPALAGTSRRR